MTRAILFLLVICTGISVAVAQVDSPDEPNQQQEQPFQNESAQPDADAEQHNPDQVENDPDELGSAPIDTQQSTPLAPSAPAAPVENNATATTSGESSGVNSATDPKNFTDKVLLQGLNKITARTSELEVKLGDSIKFGNLKITLHACWKSPPEEDTENKALLEMWEEIPGEPRSKIFSGWMFSSSPLISAPEHPVYDITVLSCNGSSTVKAAAPASAEIPAIEKPKKK